jgi:hypothetical protein
MEVHPVQVNVLNVFVALVFSPVSLKACGCILSKNLKQNDGQDKTCPSLLLKNHATYCTSDHVQKMIHGL